ncbi:MAG: hypothetical protein ACRCUY_05275 [Thermoguttaceae bacterium]
MNTDGVRERIPMPNKTRQLTLAARQNTPAKQNPPTYVGGSPKYTRQTNAGAHTPARNVGGSLNKTRERIRKIYK